MPETDRFPTFAEWHTANPEPDLRALVEQFGSCRDIPEDAWEIYERQMKDWRAMGRGSSLARGTDAASKVIPGILACTRFRGYPVKVLMEQEAGHGEATVYAGVQG